MDRSWQIPRWLYPCFPDILFRSKDAAIHLSFDDGPDPNSTPILLSRLNQFGWKASFFVLGEKAEQYPSLMEQIREEGHRVENHGYQHLDGWKISKKTFWENERSGRKIAGSNLFRPPYGHISLSAYRSRPKDVRIVLWDLMTYDFDAMMDRKMIDQLINKKLRPGAIIVMHDHPDRIEATLEDLNTIAQWSSARSIPVREIPLK